MPTLTRWFIKTSLLYLAVALALSLLLAIQPLVKIGPLVGLFPVYIHLLVFGWLTQLIFGVIYWMFPKFTKEQPRRSEVLGWWTYILLNTGLVMRAFAEPLNSTQPNPSIGWTLVVSASIQFMAGWLFVINTWGRVKEK